jgi:hypothetical protein
MNENCIMPEQPYCPACKYGVITYPEDEEEYAMMTGNAPENETWGCSLSNQDND